MDDAQTDAPLPCPFCGRAPYVPDRPIPYIKCATKGCPANANITVAIDVWNRRAALASPRATGSPVAWRSRWRNTESGEAEQWRPENDPPLARGPVGIMTFDVEPLYDHPSPSLASATAGDWRDSEAVKHARLAVIRAAEEWEGNPYGADTHDALDALCEVVQSHARASRG